MSAVQLLKVERLSLSFTNGLDEVKAVQDLSFSVAPGEIVALVGESGSGKSVTALSVLQLLPSYTLEHAGGQIWFSDKWAMPVDLLRLGPDALQQLRGNRIAMIFQEPMTSLNPVFTCGFQVMESLQKHLKLSDAEARKRAVELFEKVRLPDPETCLNKYPHQLSGGQRQRVMIAMAMSCQPALLLCDEPTTALDPSVSQTILELIKDLQRETGMGVLFITHDLALVEGFADRVIVLYKGHALEQGPALSLLTNPIHPYTKGLLNCRPHLHNKGERLPMVSDYWQEGEANAIFQEKGHTPPSESKPADNSLRKVPPFLEVRNLTVRYPAKRRFWGKSPKAFTALDNISFTIGKGEAVGLTGESGCGKTTLGRALLGLVDHDSGEVVLEGYNLLAGKKDAGTRRKALQMVFQDPYSSLNPKIRIGRAIEEVLEVHARYTDKAAVRNRVYELLDQVGLSDNFFDRYPHACSGGQRQRAVIARALATEPSFLVCDESVAALDVSVQAQVINLLNYLKARLGLTILFISHDEALVRYFCDKVLYMREGKLVQ